MSSFLYFRIEGPLNPIRSVLYEGDLFLGGGADCGLVLPHATVAARHARITGPDDRLLLSSLGPPTTVRRGGSIFVVRAGIPFPLLVGDQIGVGEVRIQLVPGPEPEVVRGGTRMSERREVLREDPPAAAPAGRRPRGATRVVDVRQMRPDEPVPRDGPRDVPREASPREAPRAPEPRAPEPRASEVPRLERRIMSERPVAERERPAPEHPVPEPPRRVSVALRPQPAARREADPLEDGPTGFFSRQALRAPTEVPRTVEEKPRPASRDAELAAQAVSRVALEEEIAALETAFERQGGAAREQRRKAEQRAALEAELQTQQRALQDAERALATARIELAGHEHELATHERRCRELEATLGQLRKRREAAETRRDESVRRLREAEQARDTTWQEVWTMEHDQLRLEGLIDNLELALGIAQKRG